MVKLVPTDNAAIFHYEFDSPSWYNDKVRKEISHLTKQEAAYIDLIQSTIRIQDASGEWIPYLMTSHELEFHLSDVAIAQEKAKIRIVKKSRNTSLTVCSTISDIFGQSEFNNPVIPYVRMNLRSALDLIDQVKGLIRHITPLVIEVPDESRRISPDVEPPKQKVYLPFNPNEVQMDAAGSVRFPAGGVIRSFPANADASETVRGLRLRGNSGFIDEANFMRYFKNIFVAIRDASAGTKNGVNIQQFTIGSTLKGMTPFSEWLDEIERSGANDIQVFDWPVFRRDLFDPYLKGECEIPFHENDKLVSIVPWHDKQKLWNTWLHDKHIFLEEYMATQVDSEEQFYPTKLVMDSVDIDENLTVEQLAQHVAYYKEIRIGLDPATSHDCFGIAVWGLDFENHWEQLMVDGPQGIELPDMEKMVIEMLDIIEEYNENWLCSVDATPIGMQITQALRKRYKHKIRGLNGNMRFENADGISIKLNEFMHTNLKRWMFENTLHLISDEDQIKDFLVWDYAFKAASTARGHGDRVMANIYALCPRNTASTESTGLISNLKTETKAGGDGDRILKEFKKRMMTKRKKF